MLNGLIEFFGGGIKLFFIFSQIAGLWEKWVADLKSRKKLFFERDKIKQQ